MAAIEIHVASIVRPCFSDLIWRPDAICAEVFVTEHCWKAEHGAVCYHDKQLYRLYA